MFLKQKIEMSKIAKILLLTFLPIYFFNCTDSSESIDENSNNEDATLNETNNSETVEIINFSNKDIARFAISSIMGTPPKIIKVREEFGIYYVFYNRQSDSKKFEYRIKIQGKEIIWASLEGRWRISKEDEKISFEEIGSKLKITQVFSDEGVVIKEFNKGD